jgi:hypothetical protein
MATFSAALLGILNQLKVLHWQTQSYAKHQAFGGAYDDLNDLIDEFVEVYMGKYGRIIIEQDDSINLVNIGEMEQDEFLSVICDFLHSFNNQFDSDKDTDLLNIRDEMLGVVNKLKYLLTLQ